MELLLFAHGCGISSHEMFMYCNSRLKQLSFGVGTSILHLYEILSNLYERSRAVYVAAIESIVWCVRA